MLALKVIPEGKKRKLRASVHISLGNLLTELLEFSCQIIDQKQLSPADNEQAAKQAVLFR